MKLTATIFLTVDGVYQGPGGPGEDTRGGFERGGWVQPYFDEAGEQYMLSVFEQADALLLGRRTWEIFESYWPHHDEGDAISHGINVLPKHVPSTTLRSPAWQGTRVIEAEAGAGSDAAVEAAIRELKAQPGRELQVHGSGELLRWLLEHDLVDELRLLIFPVAVGEGMRLFPERGQSHALELVESRTTPTGVVIQVYRPVGRATFGSMA